MFLTGAFLYIYQRNKHIFLCSNSLSPSLLVDRLFYLYSESLRSKHVLLLAWLLFSFLCQSLVFQKKSHTHTNQRRSDVGMWRPLCTWKYIISHRFFLSSEEEKEEKMICWSRDWKWQWKRERERMIQSFFFSLDLMKC